MALALLGFGSNLGDRQELITRAVAALGIAPGIHLVGVSGWHETKAVGGPAGQGAFLNGAALVETSLLPRELLAALQQIETRLGRRRDVRWGARTLDLDLLLYDDLVLDTPELVVPHPRMTFRRFVLAPAVEVAPHMVHPQLGWTVRQLWDHLNSSLPYVAIGRYPAIDASWLARQIAERIPARVVVSPDLLAPLDWEQPPLLTISDFWLDELDCVFGELTDADLKRLRIDMRPRLVLCSEMAHALVQRCVGDSAPWLRLQEGNPESNLTEVVAAILAME